jgi:hypothetical protein
VVFNYERSAEAATEVVRTVKGGIGANLFTL